ncbi:unnamed protein product [marine sediment metagenome]|uniref:InsA N-terminal domain-containing protein n=1 Tax=marine sediment metagenome TaxID=412755 RepID=X1V0G5_9ZZZZ
MTNTDHSPRCPFCLSTDIVKYPVLHGHGIRYRCHACDLTFTRPVRRPDSWKLCARPRPGHPDQTELFFARTDGPPRLTRP